MSLIPDEDEVDIEGLRAQALEALGEKKSEVPYTEESYQAYSEGFDKLLAQINAATTKEQFAELDVPQSKEQLEALLRVKEVNFDEPFDPVDEEEDEDTEDTDEEPSDTEEDTDEVPSTTPSKLSEVSEEQLKKLYTAVTGQGVGDNRKWQKTMRRMRAKLQELGESLNPEDYKPEDFIEEDLSTTADAVKTIKDTSSTLKSAAAGIKNMTNAMHEEYQKYVTPKESSEMDYLFSFVNTAVSGIINSVNSLGYSIAEYDRDGYMSGNNEYTEHIVFKSDDTFEEGEEADLAEQLKLSLENKLSEYELPNEITEVACDVLFPDEDVADALEDETTTPGTIAIYVTFARNLL